MTNTFNCKGCAYDKNGWCSKFRTNNAEIKNLHCVEGSYTKETDRKQFENACANCRYLTTNGFCNLFNGTSKLASEVLCTKLVRQNIADLDFKDYLIICDNDFKIQNQLKFRHDLETADWHYYEDVAGKIIHIKKDKQVAVIEKGRYL